jgi:DNA-binding NarL/FixJ family response regulator
VTKSKKIVVWGSEDILNSSIEYFLATKEEWKVVNISNNEDLNDLILTVDSTQPDIVIIHQTCHDNLTNLWFQLLLANPTIKVITISLENNAMEVYSIQKVMIKQASDLINVIENDPYPLLEDLMIL